MNAAKVNSETKAFKKSFLSQTPMNMALIKVERSLHHPDCEIGRLFIDGMYYCFSIEDAYRTTKIKGETCIPFGTYPFGTRFSPNFSKACNHDMFWVQNVPGFEFILIHSGIQRMPDNRG